MRRKGVSLAEVIAIRKAKIVRNLEEFRKDIKMQQTVRRKRVL